MLYAYPAPWIHILSTIQEFGLRIIQYFIGRNAGKLFLDITS